MAFRAVGTYYKDITGGYSHHDCDPNPRPSTIKGAAFGSNLRSLLAALPSAAALTGFASLGSGSDEALVRARGLCFGESPPPESCRVCLSLSALSLLAACDGNRSAAVWTDGCFLAYTDGNAPAARGRDLVHIAVAATSSYRDPSCDAGELVSLARSLAARAATGSSGRMLATADATCQAGGATVHMLAQCPRDVAAAECARCLDDSARGLPDFLYWAPGIPAGLSSLHRYNCVLRLEIFPPPPPIGRAARIRKKVKDNIVVVTVGAVVIVAIIGVASFLLVKRKINKAKLLGSSMAR
ncbi:cysteine-rich repeat secretory protein 38-like [Triticum dicoccoides]|uniref:cysteine-rich repeat secretory protein 38-like n=1 Tax=Triticum dicoccoides TaxID=85692 RepID=UPI00188FEF8B|nr:cysteine-rich repeat secretory protein 38-like [Triticum dicoccoides]